MSENIESLVRRNKVRLAELEEVLHYRFTDLRILQRALIHSSFAFENDDQGHDNERLEYLGDAVFDLIVGHLLMRTYPDMHEGELTRLRSSMVNEHSFASLARRIDLGSFLELGKGEEMNQGRQKPRILSCAWEAVAGAIFIDSDYSTVVEALERFFLPDLETKKEEMFIADSKSRLQEDLQERFSEAPSYLLEEEDGPSHARVFTVSVCFHDDVIGRGTAGSKKEAEQRAAHDALTTKSWLQ